MKSFLFLLLFVGTPHQSFSAGTAAPEDCTQPAGIVSSFTTWISGFMTRTAPSLHCPDSTLGRIEKDQSPGSKFLKELARIGSFDQALQKDPQIKLFLEHDSRLRKSRARDQNLRACISQGPTLKYLLGLDAGVKEGYDIGEHTATVLNVFLNQQKFYAPLDLGSVSNKSLHRLLLPILALHDIGKGIAVKAGNKELQHFYTSKFVRTYLRSIKFTEKEINVAIALIDHDAVGDYLKGAIPAPQARRILHERARIAGMGYGDFMKLQQLFYTSDAYAYPMLRERVFKRAKGGKLAIKDPTFVQLLN
jgi:hypothetical protein